MQDKKNNSIKSSNQAKLGSKKKSTSKKRIGKRVVPPLPSKEMVWWVKYLVILALVIVLIWPLGLGLLWSLNGLYRLIDPTEFPKLDNTIVNLMKTTSYTSSPAKKRCGPL